MRDEIPDYQLAAWLMAVVLRGMTEQETIASLRPWLPPGRRSTCTPSPRWWWINTPPAAWATRPRSWWRPSSPPPGCRWSRCPGAGWDSPAARLDKLESIPGFMVSLTTEELSRCVRRHGIAVAGQTADLAPADGRLYALRDVTATVPSLPLIASSIMSKKIASGADAIVLDVKVGHGAFMETLEQARALAELMMRIGQGLGKRVTAVLADMSQPLGCAVGNALEVGEAIDTLQGNGPADFVSTAWLSPPKCCCWAG